MRVNGNLVAERPRRHVIRSMLVAFVAVAALLSGVLAMHSACTGHETNHALHATSAQADSGADALIAGGVTAAAAAAPADSGWLAFGDNLMAGCALIAATCSILLILASLVFLARLPSTYQRLLDAGGFVVGSFRTIPLRIHRPSLTVLSIIRV